MTPGFVEPYPPWISEHVRKRSHTKMGVKDLKEVVGYIKMDAKLVPTSEAEITQLELEQL